MTILDWLLVVIWAGITLGGFWKGAVRIVFGCGGLALGIWLSVVIGDDLLSSLVVGVSNQWLALALAYLGPVFVVSGLCFAAGWGMEKTLEGLKLGCLNRVLGAVLAGTVSAVVLAVLLVTAVGISPEVARYEERSALLARIHVALDWANGDQETEAPAASRPSSGNEGSSSGR
jgi:uncharacterized membrane protein required for colicin V production